MDDLLREMIAGIAISLTATTLYTAGLVGKGHGFQDIAFGLSRLCRACLDLIYANVFRVLYWVRYSH